MEYEKKYYASSMGIVSVAAKGETNGSHGHCWLYHSTVHTIAQSAAERVADDEKDHPPRHDPPRVFVLARGTAAHG
jgi:hypothetical protein